MSGVITTNVDEPLYLNSFSIGFRFNEPEMFDVHFTKHLFRSGALRNQLTKTASGVTRHNVSKGRLAAVRIPVPPLAIQREIASILDKMVRLKEELESELELRSRQFAFYRDSLLCAPESDKSAWVRMGDVGEFIRGRRFTKRDIVEQGIPAIHYGEIYTKYGVSADQTVSHVDDALRSQLRFALPGDVVIAAVGETVADVAKSVAWVGDEPVAIHDDTFLFRSELDPKFVSYFTQTESFHGQKNKYVARAKVKRLSAEGLARILIPVPSAEEQRRTVGILDRFDVLLNDLNVGLPAEIEARRQQYQHYRDRLLTFKEAVA